MVLQTEIKVSVIILTYNHEKYIKKAIESVLMQKTTFDYEVIIADDFSTDRTKEIIQDILTKNHESKVSIRYIRNEKNLGVMASWINAYSQVNGKYIAICEGDDFWTIDSKLQKQFEVLDSHPQFSICFHNVNVEYVDINEKNYILNENIEKDIFTIDDLIGEEEIWFMATASLMIRHESLKSIPNWILKSKSGDIPIIMLAARNGHIKYLTDLMATYQKHSRGMSMTDHKNDAIFLKNRIYMYKMLNLETKFQYNYRFKQILSGYYYLMLDSKQLQNKYISQFIVALKYFYYSYPKIKNIKVVIKNYIIPPVILEFSRLIKRKTGIIPTFDKNTL